MPNYDHFFRSDRFKAHKASFERMDLRSDTIGKANCPTLVLKLENGLVLKCNRHISYSDWDPCHFTQVSHGSFRKTRSEWTEFDDDYSTFRISWESSSDGPIDLNSVIGKTITRITDYTWRTVIELGDLMFINVEFNATSYSDRDGSCCAQIGTWTNKDQGRPPSWVSS